MRTHFVALLATTASSLLAYEPCRIEIVETGSGWPVPLVELRTTHHERFVSDNAGLIALDAPELMGRETWFDVLGHGYEMPKDGFGRRGVRLTPQPGKTIRIAVSRASIARRIGRITGGGLFPESQKLGAELNWIEAGVFGSDSAQNAVHGGRLFWIWGDTVLPDYPLGIFDSSGATTSQKPLTVFEPPLRLRLDYFRAATGKPRGVARMPGEGPTWITALASLPDKTGASRLVASYMKIRNQLEIYEWGLCVWSEPKQEFERLRSVWRKTDATPQPPPIPDGHVLSWKDEHGRSWVLAGNPFPKLRFPATFESWADASTWEVLKPQESLLSAADGRRVKPHSGSIAWNDFRKRWVTVFMEHFGKPSVFGEIWYAEAKEPTGPWGPAVKVLSHDNYTFYNPCLHAGFTPDGSPLLLFEGTYTGDFADHPARTPRYDYNQILYRLDLDDPALRPARE